MALPSSAVCKVTFNVTSGSTSNTSLIPGGQISVVGATDAECDAAIVAELEARKAANQASVDTLDEVLAKF